MAAPYTQPDGEIPNVVPTPTFTPDGKLSGYMVKAVAQLTAELETLARKGDNWLGSAPEWKQSFYQMVMRGRWTPEQFFSTFPPAFADKAWQGYMGSLPEIEQTRIKSELYALYKAQNSEDDMTDQPTEAAAPKLVHPAGTLTEAGKELTNWLRRHVPDNFAGRGYLAFVLNSRMMTPGQYLRDFPNAANGLWEAYRHFSPQMAAQEAQKHLDAAAKLIDGMKQSPKPAASGELAESERQLTLLQESLRTELADLD